MPLIYRSYSQQSRQLPASGRHIMAQFDDDSVVVYQAYRPAIGHFAASHGFFGGEFSLSRMTWIKPNFLWMMYRSGWGQKPGQEVTLAVRLRRQAFDSILAQAVPSSYWPHLYDSREAWQADVASSDVRLQWDPDHDPYGDKLERRAIQLGLRREVVERYARDWIIDIEDISPFVAEQRQHVEARALDLLTTPSESPYPLPDAEVARRLGMS